MSILHDGFYEFRGFHGCKSMCYLKIELVDDKYICLAKEIPSNPGTSITNAAELLATQVSNAYGLPLDEMIWVEKYAPPLNEEETLDLVTFTIENGEFQNPQWKRIDKCAHEIPLQVLRRL